MKDTRFTGCFSVFLFFFFFTKFVEGVLRHCRLEDQQIALIIIVTRQAPSTFSFTILFLFFVIFFSKVIYSSIIRGVLPLSSSTVIHSLVSGTDHEAKISKTLYYRQQIWLSMRVGTQWRKFHRFLDENSLLKGPHSVTWLDFKCHSSSPSTSP